MKKLNFTDNEIIDALTRLDKGQTTIPELCRDMDVSISTYYKWRNKYDSMDLYLRNSLKELEAENARLRQLLAEERLKADILQQALLEKNHETDSWRKLA